MSDMKETVFEQDDHHVPPTLTTLTTFAVLAVLSTCALGVGFSPLEPTVKLVAGLLVAGVQAVVLAVYFMELKQADKLTWLCAGAAVFWVAIMFTFILTDYVTRRLGAF